MANLNLIFIIFIFSNGSFYSDPGIFSIIPYDTFADFFSNVFSELLRHLRTLISLIMNFIWKENKSPRVIYNNTAFQSYIRRHLIGQHLAHFAVPEMLNTHLSQQNPKKPLVFSIHGPPGTGKTFLTTLIAKNMFKEGMKSSSVHIFSGAFLYTSKKKKEKYSKSIQLDVAYHLQFCDVCLFVYDDVDIMIPGVIDDLVPFIKSNENDSAKSIFIFISNSGSIEIEKLLIEGWFKDKPKDSFLSSSIFSSYLRTAAYNEDGGFQRSQIIAENLIDDFIAFFPLEKDDVKQCVRKELKQRSITFTEDDVEKIADLLEYYPPDLEIFSKSGCKKVARKVELFLKNDP